MVFSNGFAENACSSQHDAFCSYIIQKVRCGWDFYSQCGISHCVFLLFSGVAWKINSIAGLHGNLKVTASFLLLVFTHEFDLDSCFGPGQNFPSFRFFVALWSPWEKLSFHCFISWSETATSFLLSKIWNLILQPQKISMIRFCLECSRATQGKMFSFLRLHENIKMIAWILLRVEIQFDQMNVRSLFRPWHVS